MTFRVSGSPGLSISIAWRNGSLSVEQKVFGREQGAPCSRMSSLQSDLRFAMLGGSFVNSLSRRLRVDSRSILCQETLSPKPLLNLLPPTYSDSKCCRFPSDSGSTVNWLNLRCNMCSSDNFPSPSGNRVNLFEYRAILFKCTRLSNIFSGRAVRSFWSNESF